MTVDTIWEQTLGILRDKINRPAYEMFVRRINPVACDEGTMQVEVPPTLSAYLNDYYDLIQDTISSVVGRRITLLAVQGAMPDKKPAPPANGPDNGSAPEYRETVQAAPRYAPPQTAYHAPAMAAATLSRPATRPRTYLNARYTFENFVVGSSNRLSHAAAMAAAEAPGKAYNPLFIYGGVGLGKTHLMQAIGHYIQSTRPNLNIQYITTDAFVNDVVTSIQENRLFEFSNHFKRTDLLMVDDIQYLQGKERTQHEFFQIFNELHEARKQIVITCDRLPKDIPTLTERLKSRLGWGLIADINEPDYETRLAILQMKLQSDQVDMPDGVLDLIASTVKTNIRDLEGTLNRIMAYSHLNGQEITLEFVEKIIKDIAPPADRGPVAPDKIIAVVARYFNIPVEEVKGRRRIKEIVHARHVAMFLIRELTDMTLQAVGAVFDKDHSSVLTSCDKIKKECDVDAELRRTVETLRTKLYTA